MNDLLELPDLGRVPRAWTVYAESPLSAAAAQAFLSSPFGAYAEGATSATGVIQQVVRGWLKSFTDLPGDPPGSGGEAHTLAQVFRPAQVCFELRAEYSETDEGAMRLELHALRQRGNERFIGQRLKAAEQLTGLGQSALSALAHAADAGLPILLPETLLQMTAGRKHMRARLKSYPRWVLEPQMLQRKTLEGLANPHRTRFTGRLARAILAVEDAVAAARDVRIPKRERFTDFPVALLWERTGANVWDSAYRMITDDWLHEHDGRASAIHRLELKPGPKLAPALNAFLSSLASTGPILQAATRLVYELSDRKRNDD